MSQRSSIRDHHLHHHHHHHHNNNNINNINNNNNPSFSSTLLEEIYRSFDEERDRNHRIMTSSAASMKKSNSCSNRYFAVDRWIENEKLNLRRKPTPPPLHADDCRRRINHSSSTSSSDSSSGIGGFSSSDTESIYGSAKKSSLLLKPIRTQNPAELHRKIHSDDIPAKTKKKSSKEGNLQRRALKLYSELKKVKQPISPGGKLSSFLNSLFHSNASKKPPSPSTSNGVKMERESPAMASRSCLSKTPSSAGRFERRSVRFVDDDQRERKCDVAMRDSSILASDVDFKLQIKEKQRRVEEVAKELLKNYHHQHHNRTKELTVNIVTADSKKFERNVVNNNNNNVRDLEEEDADDDEDDVSCCSSDLFELENLLEIGMVDGRYCEELPVYETTHVHTNRAIANGFIL